MRKKLADRSKTSILVDQSNSIGLSNIDAFRFAMKFYKFTKQ